MVLLTMIVADVEEDLRLAESVYWVCQDEPPVVSPSAP